MILDLQQTFKNKPIQYLCYSQLNVTVLRMSSSVTTLYVNLWPGSATARMTAVTTRMRTLKSAVRVDTDLFLVPRSSFMVADVFYFHVGFFLSGKFQCPPTRAFRCQNDRVCLQVSKRCDGVNNCGDNSDEMNCRTCWRPSRFQEICTFRSCKENISCVSTETPPAVPTCEKDEFLCANHRCISSTLRCNLFNDCEDFGSDEIGCKTGSFFQKQVHISHISKVLTYSAWAFLSQTPN